MSDLSERIDSIQEACSCWDDGPSDRVFAIVCSPGFFDPPNVGKGISVTGCETCVPLLKKAISEEYGRLRS